MPCVNVFKINKLLEPRAFALPALKRLAFLCVAVPLVRCLSAPLDLCRDGVSGSEAGLLPLSRTASHPGLQARDGANSR